MDVLISGMGIGGPTLAYWLKRGGHRPVIVEAAPRLRRGGYIIDFWGLGYDIAGRMGLLPRIRNVGYMIKEIRLVNARGAKAGGFSAGVFERATKGRYVSLPRSELSAAICDALSDDTEVLWGESISGIDDAHDKVAVRFAGGAERQFDLVAGADGLHSNVRALCFGPESDFESYLGYKVAAFEADGYPHRDEDIYVSFAKPGLQIARFSMRKDRTLFLLVYHDEAPHLSPHHAPDDVKGELRQRFGGIGWESDEILEAMDAADQLYFDRVSQILQPAWSNGRVCLLGDAAAAPSLLAGEGAAMAMIEAFVLAGELMRAGNDPRPALERYEARLRPFVEKKQKAAKAFASSFAPRTAMGIAIRNLVTRAFDLPFVADLFLGASVKDDFELPAYGFDV